MAGVPCLIRSKHIDVDYPNKFFSRIAYGSLPHHVLTTSQKIRQKICDDLSVPSALVTNMPTGIDPELYHTEVPPTLRMELKTSPDAPLAGMISVIRSWKGHRYFLESALELVDKVPGIRFVIVGDGPGYPSLLQAVQSLGLQERVFCLGHRQDVPQILKTLNVLVLPSTAHEGVPQIILQAQLARCPVVATSIGGIPEVVHDGSSGRLVPPANSEALAKAIFASLKQQEQTLAMVDQAYQRAMRENTLSVMCSRTEAVYQRFVS
jgi:glycosyltransferase involved in cell wall biosynthesis